MLWMSQQCDVENSVGLEIRFTFNARFLKEIYKNDEIGRIDSETETRNNELYEVLRKLIIEIMSFQEMK